MIKKIKQRIELAVVYLKMYLDYCLLPALLVMHLMIAMYKGAKYGWSAFMYDYKGAMKHNRKKLNAYKGELND